MMRKGDRMPKPQTMLIVEDDASQLNYYIEFAREAGFDAHALMTLEDATEYLRRQRVDVLLTDIHLSASIEQTSFEGLRLLQLVKDEAPETIAIAMSSDPKLDTYNKAIQAGAWHYLRKPVRSSEELAIDIEAARQRKLATEVARRLSRHPTLPNNQLLTECPDGLVLPQKIREIAKKVAMRPRIPVTITGETGTGKEEVAKLIHRLRCEVEGTVPFVAVNCAHLNSDVAMSTLFGHVKGAFTGADRMKRGYIEEADGGILFLDEVHTLDLEVQKKLLRVLNDGSFERVGDTKPLRAEFQVIVATTRNLEEEVDASRFLLDLRMRLLGVDIPLKPLRKRFEDLPLLLTLFFAKEQISISQEDIERLTVKCQEYYWQGNIRQLYKVLQSMAVMASLNDEGIDIANLPEYRTMFPPDSAKAADLDPPLAASPNQQPLDGGAGERILKALKTDVPFAEAMDFYEKSVLQAAMQRHGTLAEMLNALDMAKSSFMLKRKKYGI